MLRPVLLAFSLSMCTASTAPYSNNACRDIDGPWCPPGHLFAASSKVSTSACKPFTAGESCATSCRIAPEQPWVGQNTCDNPFDYSFRSAETGPECWRWAYLHCAGSRQSPVNIVKRDAIELHSGLPLQIETAGDERNPKVDIGFIENNGRFLRAELTPASSKKTFLRYGPLEKKYQVTGFIYHFNSNGKGSEHAFNGQKTDGEIQIMAFDSSYGCFEVASSYCDGVAIISVPLTATRFPTTGNALGHLPPTSMHIMGQFLMRATRNLKHCGKVMLRREKFPLKWLLPSGFERRYYVYQGSLTTPPCSESVLWIVLDKGLQVPSTIWKRLSSIKSGLATAPRMNGNSRPLQPLNGRKVYLWDSNRPTDPRIRKSQHMRS